MKIHLYVAAILIVALSVIMVDFDTSPSVAQSPVSSEKRILGITARRNPDYGLIKETGIEWVRMNFRFPFEDKIGGRLSDDFLNNLEEAKKVRGLGLRIMGVTPGPGSTGYDAVNNPTNAWRPRIPAWAGPVGSDRYFETYEETCEELARQTKGIVDMWQVANEPDHASSRGPMSIEQMARFLLAGARGLKAVNPQLKADINPGNINPKEGEPLVREVYKPGTPFDFAGIDGYFGGWDESNYVDGSGLLEAWVPLIDHLYVITGKPVLINEWGYSSLQGSGIPLGRKTHQSVCDNQTWGNRVWRKEHSPEEQAAYVEMPMKIFATYPHVAGAFFFEWSDNPVCPHCGTKGCPSECGWGLVDSQGKPKPAYYAFKALAHEYW